MKLLLTSSGLWNDVLKYRFLKLVGKPMEEIKLLFIPTAANGEKSSTYVDKNRDSLFEMGIARDNLIEYDLDEDVSGISLEDIDVIYVEGGNTYYLLDKFKKTGFYKKLAEMLARGVVYVGVSAGSISMGANIDITNPDTHDDFGITDRKGLGYTDKAICPHFNKKTESFLDRFRRNNSEEVVRLNDGQALLIDENGEELIG